MIQAVQQFDNVVAAGFLARAALSLGYDAPLSEDEAKIRENIIEEARTKLGLAPDDYGEQAIDKISEFLDEESEKLLAPLDTQSALVRLAERGDLPSDLYEVRIVENIAAFHGKNFDLEKQIIESTIRDPDREQHYGLGSKPYEPRLISLFLRYFRTKWPHKDFHMLVAGQRDGLILNIHQAWRIYISRVDVAGAQQPIDWLQRFADRYGVPLNIRGITSTFFLFTEANVPTEVKWNTGPKPKTIQVTRFDQWDGITRKAQAALVVGIDLDKYEATLKEMRVRREDMFNEYVPAPRALD
jgi:hypothetical protein